MVKAILAAVVTFLTGWLGMAIGFELWEGVIELGVIVAISVMGAFIIYFNEKK